MWKGDFSHYFSHYGCSKVVKSAIIWQEFATSEHRKTRIDTGFSVTMRVVRILPVVGLEPTQ